VRLPNELNEKDRPRPRNGDIGAKQSPVVTSLQGERNAIADSRQAMNGINASILIVDDDPDVCQNMSDIFRDLGFWVDSALEGRSALRLVERQAYDIVLFDLSMPGIDGLTLCREVLRLRPATVALLITGYPEEVQPREAQSAGLRDVVSKPVDVPRLLSQIRRTQEGSRPS
jgi:CheY-like chemotaxis protein